MKTDLKCMRFQSIFQKNTKIQFVQCKLGSQDLGHGFRALENVT